MQNYSLVRPELNDVMQSLLGGRQNYQNADIGDDFFTAEVVSAYITSKLSSSPDLTKEDYVANIIEQNKNIAEFDIDAHIEELAFDFLDKTDKARKKSGMKSLEGELRHKAEEQRYSKLKESIEKMISQCGSNLVKFKIDNLQGFCDTLEFTAPESLKVNASERLKNAFIPNYAKDDIIRESRHSLGGEIDYFYLGLSALCNINIGNNETLGDKLSLKVNGKELFTDEFKAKIKETPVNVYEYVAILKSLDDKKTTNLPGIFNIEIQDYMVRAIRYMYAQYLIFLTEYQTAVLSTLKKKS